MDENTNDDVKTEESTEQVETKVEDTTSSESSTDEKVEKSIPYSRFKEVNDKVKSLEERLSSLDTTSQHRELSEKEKTELNAKTYLRNMLKEVLTEEEKSKQEAEERELKEFNSEVSSILELNPNVKKNEFLDFIEKNSSKYGITSISGAMTLYKDLNSLKSSAKEEGKKEVLSKPKFPSGDTTNVKNNYDFKGKSLYDIARESIEEMEGK